jgi:hypothetical protein
VRYRPPRILDASAIVAFFAAHPRLMTLLDQADAGQVNLLLPTTAIAEAQSELRHTLDQWHALLFSPGVRSMPLSEHCAVEIGAWPGGLATRHTVHESQSMRAAVVTREPALYRRHIVSLLVI